MLNKSELFEKMLMQVEKPVRYTGNEYNRVLKDTTKVDVRYCFAFPDVYEVGMSHLGLKILYHLINEREDTYCERVFAPWVDMEEQLRKNNVPLFAVETRDELSVFDIIGFTLQYEMSYTNILNMLDLANIPLLKKDRGNEDPIIMVGGPCTVNCEPLADFIDVAIIGEGEEVINKFLDVYADMKKSGSTKEEILKKAAQIKGVYVPGLYNVTYKADNTINDITPIDDTIPDKIAKQIVRDFDNSYFPENIILPFMNVIHDRVMLEIFRGCTRGCRFCQAGMIYRPLRERKLETILDIAKKSIDATGYEEISLASLSTGDYSKISELVEALMDYFYDKRVSIALPSLRIDSFTGKYADQIKKVKKTGLTFAPEAGSQRLRDVINKGVTEDDLKNSCFDAFLAGWDRVKLYFMIGLPTENDEDLVGISELCKTVVNEYKSALEKGNRPKKRLQITASTACFVPKPHTPFQWVAQPSVDDFNEKINLLKNELKQKYVKYNWHEPNLSTLEGAFARGDRRLGSVLLSAFKNGCKFDGWHEHFKYEQWMKAFLENDIDIAFYNNRKRELDEVLPWDHIDVGVSKKFLAKEYDKALKGEVTKDCRDGCIDCGITALYKGGCAV